MDLGLSGATALAAAAAAAAAAASFAPPPPALAFLIALSMSTSFDVTSSSLEPSPSPGARIPSSKLPRLEKRGRSSEKRRSQCLFKKMEYFQLFFGGGYSVFFVFLLDERLRADRLGRHVLQMPRPLRRLLLLPRRPLTSAVLGGHGRGHDRGGGHQAAQALLQRAEEVGRPDDGLLVNSNIYYYHHF